MKVTKPNKNSKEKETNTLYLEGSAVYEWICQPPGMKLVRATTSRQQLLNVSLEHFHVYTSIRNEYLIKSVSICVTRVYTYLCAFVSLC